MIPLLFYQNKVGCGKLGLFGAIQKQREFFVCRILDDRNEGEGAIMHINLLVHIAW